MSLATDQQRTIEGTQPTAITKQPTLIRSLGLGDAMMLVVGCIVGVGIFRTASSIASFVQSPLLMLGLWLIGGLLSLCGALCYAELAAMFPQSGGDYVYIREIYGRCWGFVFGWTKLFVERTGTIAILGFVFSEYLSRILHYDATTSRWVAASAVLILTTVNVGGTRWGTYVQNLFTSLKIAALIAIMFAGVLAARHAEALHPDWSLPIINRSVLQSMGVALVFVLWTYGGWTEAAYVAEEIRQPTRNVPRALLVGLTLTAGLYLLVNWSYLQFIPIAQLPTTPLVASTVMQQALGNFGAVFITAMVACSAFGALNGYILTGGRILYALGKDHALFAQLGAIHPTRHTPARALWLNALIAMVLIWTKTFDQIMTYSTVAISVFFTLSVFGVIRLRWRKPTHPRPYKTWGYPLTPLLFCLTMTGFIVNILMKEPREALFGFGFLAIGLPLYWWSRQLESSCEILGRRRRV